MLQFFASLNGRIGRMHFWLLMLGVSVAIVVALIVILWVLVSFRLDIVLIPSGWAGLLTLPLIYPWFVVYVKRGHDRNLPAWVMAAYFVALIGEQLLSQQGWIAIRPGETWHSPANLTAETLEAVLMLASLYLLFELGFRRGTPGTNRFGPDPLARQFRTNTERIRRRAVEGNGAT